MYRGRCRVPRCWSVWPAEEVMEGTYWLNPVLGIPSDKVKVPDDVETEAWA